MKNLMYTLLCFIGISIVSVAQKQGQERVDSLRTEITRFKHDTSGVNFLCDLSRSYYLISKHDSGTTYGLQALALARTIGWKNGTADAYNRLGATYLGKSDFAKSKEAFSEAYRLYAELGLKSRMLAVVLNFAVYHSATQELNECIHDHERAMQLYRETGDTVNSYLQLIEVAGMIRDSGNLPGALNMLEQARKHFTETHDVHNLAQTHLAIGQAYMVHWNYPKALKHYLDAVQFEEQNGNKEELADIFTNVANLCIYMRDYSKAAEYQQKVVLLARELGDNGRLRMAISNQAEGFMKLGAIDRALDSVFRVLELERAMPVPDFTPEMTSIAAQCRRLQGRYLLAIAWGRRAIRISDSLFLKVQMNSEPTKMEARKEIGLSILAFTKSKKPVEIGVLRAQDSCVVPYLHDSFLPSSPRKQAELASTYLLLSLEGARTSRRIDIIIECLEGLADANQLIGNDRKAMEYYREYVYYKDSVLKAENMHTLAAVEVDNAEERAEAKQNISELALKQATTERRFLFGGMFLLLCSSGLLFNRYHVKRKANVVIEHEKQRSEALLLNILPFDTAEELKATGSAKARHYDEVTVFFTDFCDFTKTSEHLSPEDLVNEIHYYFSAFDDIIKRHGVEKIKTIGDSYMCAAGVPLANTTHALDAARAATEILEFVEAEASRRRNENRSFFRIRVGIHTGPIVAGIVGTSKFAYDIWGDAVNTASRMESHGEAGRIHCSAAFVAQLRRIVDHSKDDFNIIERGEMEIKGKGLMQTYFLEKPL